MSQNLNPGFSPEEIQDIIDKHTFNGLKLKMEFVQWKKTS
jgi:hypothetical protein